MMVVLKKLRWIGVFGLLILIGGGLYIGASEVYIYLTRSDVKAQMAAQELFHKICDRQGIDSHSFNGPMRLSLEQDYKNDQYTFIWSRAHDETIYINVSYLPYDFAYSISETTTEHKGKVQLR